MDENRTHPGRLNSAPQTVLETAGLVCASVHQSPSEFDLGSFDSMAVHDRALSSAMLAVILAVEAALVAPSYFVRCPAAQSIPDLPRRKRH